VEKIEKNFKDGFLSKEEKAAQVIEIWRRTKTEIEKLVPKILPPLGPVFSIVDSGSRGSWSQPVQMAGMKGLVINPMGQIIELPVKSSFKEGFDVLEYFISTHGARKGTADTALRTSHAGYLTRRLIDVSHDMIVTLEDCGDDKGTMVYRQDAQSIGQDFASKILGRVILEDVKIDGKILVKEGEIINHELAEKIAESPLSEIRIRSMLSCQAPRGVCQKCYGWDLGENKLVEIGEAMGIVAAQSIGEPGTQLTMKTFHMGGVAGAADITQGLPRVEEIFECRPPVGKALISQLDGVVTEVQDSPKIRIVKIKADDLKKKSEIVEYIIPSKMAIWVKSGDKVSKGQQLCEGSVDLKELFKTAGQTATQRYILKEIQKIYISQGAGINDKHIELITRQMFSRVRIKDAGDSQWTSGEIVELARFNEENLQLKKENKKPANFTQIILGISRVALTCDSFLSAASFQETSRVFIRVALEGKEDKLRGLKENVIIGKLIPAGTGFTPTPNEDSTKP
jgi:DNA-directed RNA polymerase subunit beta'